MSNKGKYMAESSLLSRLVEYGLIISLVAIFVIGVLTHFCETLDNPFEQINDAFEGKVVIDEKMKEDSN